MLTVQRSNAPTGQSTPRGVQFLSPRHIDESKRKNGDLFEIVKVTTDKADNFGNPYVVYYTRAGVKYSKGYAPTSDALAQLAEIFGLDEAKWKGKKVLIGVSVDADSGERLTYAKG